MPVGPPEQCPVCRYDLQGLTPPHRCPECGFEYDEQTLVWRPRRPVWVIIEFAGILLGLGLMAAVLLPDLRTQARGELIVAGVLVLGVGGLITIWGISRVAASRRKGFFVAITPAGLWIRSPTDEELVEWGDYRDVMISTVGTFARRRSTIRSINLSGVLDDGDDLAGFQEALLEAEERYRKGTDPPSGPS